MYRIDSANNISSLPAMVAAETTPGYFNNAPGAGPGTKVTGDWMNAVQEEIAGVVEGASITLDRTNHGQLLAAIQALVAGVLPTGFRGATVGTAAPAGWVLASGRTIGDGASGGTERANTDCMALFTLLWNDYSDAELPVQTSGGAGSTRGASAVADWGAHKRITLPDYRGRTGIGKGDMGGTDAARVTVAGTGVDGTLLGHSGGEQTHVLAAGEIPGVVGTVGDSGGGSAITALEPTTATAHNNMQPFIIENAILKL